MNTVTLSNVKLISSEMDTDIAVDVGELGDDVNIDDILQSVPWAQMPTKQRIHLYVVRKDPSNELSVVDLEIGSHVEAVVTKSPTREEIPPDQIQEVEPVINTESDCMNETGFLLPGKITLDSGQMSPQLIDLETVDVREEVSRVSVDIDNCIMTDDTTQTIDTKEYPGDDVQIGFKDDDVEVPVNSVQIGFKDDVVEVPVNPVQIGFKDDVVEVPVNHKCLLASENDKPEFVHKECIEVDKAENHGDKVCRTEGRSLNSDASSNEFSKMCPLCSKEVPSEVNLYKHLLWHLLVKNTNEKHFADPLTEEEFSFDGLIVKNKSFEELLGECKQHVKYKDGLYCKLCFKNFEFHYDFAQLIDLVEFSVPPKCIECHEVYKDSTSLEIHLRKHLGSKPFGCCICRKVFEDVSEVKLHMASHIFHSYGKFFQCRYCSKLSFTENDNKLHELCHLKASNLWKFSSKLECQKITTSEGSNCYKSEKVVDEFFHPVSSAVYDFTRKLPGCENAFEVVEEVSKFAKLETSSCKEKVLLEGELRALTSVINLSKELGELLSEEQNTSRRIDISAISGQLMAYNQVLTSSYGSILTDLCKQKFWCNFCGQSFSDLEVLYSHKNVCHKAPKLFSCEDCNAEFNSMDLLFEHRNTHRELHVENCPICDTNFNFKFDITQHLKVHFADTLRRCPECGVKFKFHSHLVQHLQTHTEISPFLDECKQCNAFFAGKDQLNKHMLRMHLVERPYECSVCGKRFFRQNVWLLHSKGHIRNRFRKSLKGMDLYKPCKWSKTKVLKS